MHVEVLVLRLCGLEVSVGPLSIYHVANLHLIHVGGFWHRVDGVLLVDLYAYSIKTYIRFSKNTASKAPSIAP